MDAAGRRWLAERPRPDPGWPHSSGPRPAGLRRQTSAWRRQTRQMSVVMNLLVVTHRFRLRLPTVLWHEVGPRVTVANAMPAAAIEFRDVSFTRPGGVRVLDRFSLSVDTGDVLALVGRSGAGKSTLLKLINRLLEPDRGAVLVEQRDTREWEPI